MADEGNWTWDGDNDGNTTLFWDVGSTVPQVGFTNWGTTNNVQNEPDNFAGFFGQPQNALAMSLNGWPSGVAGQWNDLHEGWDLLGNLLGIRNELYYIVEYPVGFFPASSAVRGGFETDAVSYTHLTLPTICSV